MVIRVVVVDVVGGDRDDASDNGGSQGNEQRHQRFKIVKRQFFDWPIKQIDNPKLILIAN